MADKQKILDLETLQIKEDLLQMTVRNAWSGEERNLSKNL